LNVIRSGLVIDRIPAFVPNQVIRTEHDAVNGGSDIIKLLLKICEEREIPVLRRTASKKILTSSAGIVTGVIAENEGREFHITAKGVIIASGGFAGNKELLKKYVPWYTEDIRYHGLPHTGDGILKALWLRTAGILCRCGFRPTLP